MKKRLITFMLLALPLAVWAQNGNGSHFKINIPEAGMLKQRLTNAVYNTDYDIVDSLTVKGQFGGEDLAYLVEAKGLVAELSYLDLSDVELVYDDKEYQSSSYSINMGMIQVINHYMLSSENRDEHENYLAGRTVEEHTYYRNDFAYAFKDNKTLIDCRLPKLLKGIGEEVFRGCEALEKVTFPDSPAYIGNSAFRNSGMTSITLPASVEKVGDYAFAWMPIEDIDLSHVRSVGKGLLSGTKVKSVQLADGMEAVPEEMFSNCWELTSVVIPNSVKSIGNKAFEECNNLTTVSIPGSVETIGDEVFYSCDALTTVAMAEGLKKIGANVFIECLNLQNLTLPSTLEEMGDHAIPILESMSFEDGILYIGKVAYALEMNNPSNNTIKEEITTLNFKEGIVSIADGFKTNAFDGKPSVDVSAIKTISLPSTLRRIGSSSLSGTSINSITLPDALEYIGSYAFHDSKKLRRITIPANVKFIGPAAFDGSALTRVYYNATAAETDKDSYPVFKYAQLTFLFIGEGVKKIPYRLFEGCSNLSRVVMPSTVESIGEKAFTGCTSLEHIDLPVSLKEIGEGAFSGGLQSVAAYMKEPLLFRFDEEAIISELYPAWREAINNGETEYYDERYQGRGDNEYFYGHAYASNPFGTRVNDTRSIEGYFRIDTEGRLSWGYWDEDKFGKPAWEDEMRQIQNIQIPLLQVPNGCLSAYMANAAWTCEFGKIETFDGASDVEAVEETTTVSVSETVTDDIDLSGTMLGNVYVTLDTEESGDGYNATEGCLVINSTTGEDALTVTTTDDADNLTVKNLFNGLIFEVPAGKGSIVIDCQTLGQNAIFMKIGSGEPQQVVTATKQQVTVPYEVSEPTRIYVYADKSSGSAAPAVRRANAYANDDAVKIYGLTINVEENYNGIITPTAVTVIADGKWYTLDGRCIASPLQKGIYITNGCKVVLK